MVWECSFLLQLLSAGFAGKLRHMPNLSTGNWHKEYQRSEIESCGDFSERNRIFSLQKELVFAVFIELSLIWLTNIFFWLHMSTKVVPSLSFD